MKLCINCLHFAPGAHANQELWAVCTRIPAPPEISPVTGESRPGKPTYCTVERSMLSVEHCGQDGRFWQSAAGESS